MPLSRALVPTVVTLLFGLSPALGGLPARGRGRRRGPAHLGRAHLARPDVVRPGRDPGHDHPVHGPLRPARRAGEAHARPAAGAGPGRVVVGLEGRPRLRVRAPQGRALPQRRPGHRGRREVLAGALPRHRGQGAEGARGRGGDARSRARAHPAEAALARFPDLLHQRHRRGLDRAAQVRGEGGRRGLQEGPGGRGPLQVRLLHARRGAGAGGLRAVLAQEPEREAAGAAGDPGRGHAAGRAQARRGGHRVLDPRRAGRGDAEDARPHPQARGDPGPVLALLRRPVGSQVAVARPAGAAGREPRHRPAVHQPGPDPRPLAPQRQHHPDVVRVLLAAARARSYDPRPGQEAPGRGGLSRRASTRASTSATAPTPISARRSPTPCSRWASG